MKKHILTLFTVLLLLFGLSMTAYAADAPSTTVIDGETYYQIATADDLYWFAEQVDAGDTEIAINAILTADIVVNEGTMTADSTNVRVWNPIGYGDDSANCVRYNGVFDGNGYSISGLYFNGSGAYYVGLFCMTGDQAVIKNVSVLNSYFKGYGRIGSVVGYNEGTVVRCSSNSMIDSNGSLVGGIVGENVCDVVDCTFFGSVSGNSNVGGIVGINSDSGRIMGCDNSGTVSATGLYYAGGIVGDNRGSIVDCLNTGNVSAGRGVNGGIAGVSFGKIINCCNSGTVTSGENIKMGSIAGWNGRGGAIYNSYYDSTKFIGAAVGDNEGTIDSVSGGKSAEELASGAVAYALQQGCTVEETEYPGDAWGQNLDNGKPVQTVPTPSGATVYYGYSDCHGDTVGYTNVNRLTPGHNWSGFVKQTDGYFGDVCSYCGDANEEAFRIYGNNRSRTAIAAADVLKGELGVEKFDAIIIASGTNFADALAGSYLAAVKSAPILLNTKSAAADNRTYILNNLSASGTVYILGGTSAVPAAVAEELEADGITVKHLYGKDRFATNIAILQEAGVAPGTEVLVCTGYNFADSLSASATGLPILLVNTKDNKLTAEQQQYLHGLSAEASMLLTILGGSSAVSEKFETALGDYGTVDRIYGNSRYETSLYISRVFFPACDTIYVAYGQNFPDGLSGGPLAYAMHAPLLLIDEGEEHYAGSWIEDRGVDTCYVMGGDGVISDDSVLAIFN